MTVEKKPAKKGANRRAPSNLQYGFANQKSVIGEQHPLAKATQLLPHIEKASRHLLPDDPNQLGGSKDDNFSVFFFLTASISIPFLIQNPVYVHVSTTLEEGEMRS